MRDPVRADAPEIVGRVPETLKQAMIHATGGDSVASMNIVTPDLKAQLLARLRPFVTPVATPGEHGLPGRLFSYCALTRERLAAVTPEKPILGVVLRGAKEVWHGDRAEVLTPGTLFALPAGIPVDVVNIPDPRSGVYESLVLCITQRPAGIAPQPLSGRLPCFTVGLTPDLVEALAHAATDIADARRAEAVKDHRIAELLTLLADDPAGRLVLAADLPERAAWLLASDPSHPWTVAELARRLAVGASTLRRELDAAGRPFRSLLAEARMQAAQDALHAGASLTEAALAAGYASRSHFNRAYRSVHGRDPAEDQIRKSASRNLHAPAC